MVDFANRFPNVYVDSSGNLRMDHNRVSISGGAIETNVDGDLSTINLDLRTIRKLYGDGGVYFKNEQPNPNDVINDYVRLGFENNLPILYSSDFNNPKRIEAWSTVYISNTTTLDPSDEFIIFQAGTPTDPVIINLPEDDRFVDAKVFYRGGVGNYFGQLQSGNKEIVVFNTSSGQEVARDVTLDLNIGADLEFRFLNVSTDPFVTEWVAKIN